MSADPASFERSMVLSGQAALPSIPPRDVPPPVQYEQALGALIACRTIDEARTWSDKADALAAWAKIYADDRVALEARRLKLHAYRRIGVLAAEVAKITPRSPTGRPVSGNSVLTKHGFNTSQKLAICRLGRLPSEQFDEFVNARKPKSPSTLSHIHLTKAPKYRTFSHALGSLLAKIRKFPAAEIAGDMEAKDRATALRQAREVEAWLHELIHAIKESECET